jgi:hypothetical protein
MNLEQCECLVLLNTRIVFIHHGIYINILIEKIKLLPAATMPDE